MLPELLYGVGPTWYNSRAIRNSHTSITIIRPILYGRWHRRFLALYRRSTAFYCNLSGFLPFNGCLSRGRYGRRVLLTCVIVHLWHFCSVCLIFDSLGFCWCVGGSWVRQVIRRKPLRGKASIISLKKCPFVIGSTYADLGCRPTIIVMSLDQAARIHYFCLNERKTK